MESSSGGSATNPKTMAFAQIAYQVSSLSKNPNDFEPIYQDIKQLVEVYGPQAEGHLLRCLFSAVDFSGDSKGSSKDPLVRLLVQQCSSLMMKPNFVSLINYALLPNEKMPGMKLPAGFFHQLIQTLQLSPVQQVVFAIALWKCEESDIQTQAARHLRGNLADTLANYRLQFTSGKDDLTPGDVKLRDLSEDVLHGILLFIFHNPEEVTGVSQAEAAAFVDALKRDISRERMPVILLPLLYPDPEQQMRGDPSFPRAPAMVHSCNAIGRVMVDIGYNAMATVESAESFLRSLCGGDLKTEIVAMCLGVMAKTHTGLHEGVPYQRMYDGQSMWEKDRLEAKTWNIECFVDACMMLSKSLDWAEVMAHLDHPDFKIVDVRGLHVILAAYERGSKGGMFPVGAFLRGWSNHAGQLSLLTQALLPTSDFNFADFPLRKAAYEHLKVQPDENDSNTMCWTCLELLQALFRLSEAGHYESVSNLFVPPSKNCADVLLLSMLQARPVQWCPLQKDLFIILVPVFFNKHENSSVVLNYTWNAQAPGNSIHVLMMQSMADWYQRGDKFDQMRLSRILDVAQELKGLLMLVNSNEMPMPFVVDLAALASRRGYLKLDKWLHDRMRDQQEAFVQGCLSYLRHRTTLHGPMNVSAAVDRPGALPLETITTMLACIQSFAPMTSDTQDQLHILLKLFGPIPPKPRSVATAPPGTVSRSILPKTPFDAMPPVPLAQVPIQPPAPLPQQVPMPAQPILHHGADMADKAGTPMGAAFPPNPSMGGAAGFGGGGAGLGSLMATPASARPSNNTNAASANTMSQQAVKGGIQEQQFSNEVEEEANDNFKRLYNRMCTIDDVLEMLRVYKDSTEPKKKDVFNCMLRNLFEEYKFFSTYPDKELQITGQLFGGLIEHNLVTYMYLGLALRYILESLRKPTGHKLFSFGIACLDRCRHQLKSYPQYCGHVAAIAHFTEFPKHIQDHVTYGRDSKEPPTETAFRQAHVPSHLNIGEQVPHIPAGGLDASFSTMSSQSVPPTPTSSSGATTASNAVASVLREPRDGAAPSVANATNIDTLVTGMEGGVSEQIEAPPEHVQDRVSFLFNNLTSNNLQRKVADFMECVVREHYPWVAQHLVVKRISIEHNFHSTYVEFIMAVGNRQLTALVLSETYRNIRVLLNSEKDASNFSDRSILKNLGQWLGLLTLARNVPILHRDLCLKDLLIEANQRGQNDLHLVVPFVTKLLEASVVSKIFKPPCPWTMAILGVLCELHNLPHLKLNLKFAVEVLCKALKIDMKDVVTHNALSDGRPLSREQLVTAKERAMLTGESTAVLPTARFRYKDVVVISPQHVGSIVTVSEDIPIFKVLPHFLTLVKAAVSTAISELITPVVERSIKIAIATTEQIVRKDFALDPEDHALHDAAQKMVRNLTAGMVMITCREPLLTSITNHLKNSVSNEITARVQYNPADAHNRALIEPACNQAAAENVEAACVFIQKTAVEKVVSEMEKRIADDIEIRQQWRLGGRKYYSEQVLTYQRQHMPETIRLSLGAPDANHMAVYDEFARCLPGFLPSEVGDDFGQLMENCANDVDAHARTIHNIQYVAFAGLLSSLASTTRQIAGNRDKTGALLLLNKAVDGFLEGVITMPREPDASVMNHFREGVLAVFHALRDPKAFGVNWLIKNVTRIWSEAREEIKYQWEAVVVFIRHRVINIQDLDVCVAKHMESGGYLPLSFAIELIRHCLIEHRDEFNMVAKAEFAHMCESLKMFVTNRPSDPAFAALANHARTVLNTLNSGVVNQQQQQHSFVVESGDEGIIPGSLPGPDVLDKAPGGLTSTISSESVEPAYRKSDDPQGMSDKVEYLLTEWVRLHHQANFPLKDMDRMHEAYLQRLRTSNMLKTDDTVTRFFRISTELCVELCYRNLQGDIGQASLLSRAKCYHTMDAFVKLAIVFVKHAGDPGNTTARMSLLSKILSTVAWVLLKDHESRSTDFHQLPYHRFYSMLLLELSMTGVLLENISYHVMETFCTVFHQLRPQRVPGFAYGWLELISHRVMLSRLLGATNRKGWLPFQTLLLDMLKFMSPFLRNAELPKPLQQLYKGLLRVLLVLLHDFPEFLCHYHAVFCDVVPPNCIQMRNLILSAFPRNMRLPDPFTPNLKVSQLSDITQAPQMLQPTGPNLMPSAKTAIEAYVKTGQPSNIPSDLVAMLLAPWEDTTIRYNVPLLNAIVLHLGTQAVTLISSKNTSVSAATVATCPQTSLLHNLTAVLETDGRYLLLNSIANQLRYPNSHTHYFSCVLLHLFSEAPTEAVQEQITRVLLERLIVNRPHPWGLLITFIELIKESQYNFWQHQFVHCAPEIEKLFESVARSCTQPKAPVRDIAESHEQ